MHLLLVMSFITVLCNVCPVSGCFRPFSCLSAAWRLLPSELQQDAVAGTVPLLTGLMTAPGLTWTRWLAVVSLVLTVLETTGNGSLAADCIPLAAGLVHVLQHSTVSQVGWQRGTGPSHRSGRGATAQPHCAAAILPQTLVCLLILMSHEPPRPAPQRGQTWLAVPPPCPVLPKYSV